MTGFAMRSIRKTPSLHSDSTGNETGCLLFLYITPMVFIRLGNPQFSCHFDQICQRGGRHFAHDLSTMNLDGDLTVAEFGRSLLVEEAGYHERQDLPLARR